MYPVEASYENVLRIDSLWLALPLLNDVRVREAKTLSQVLTHMCGPFEFIYETFGRKTLLVSSIGRLKKLTIRNQMQNAVSVLAFLCCCAISLCDPLQPFDIRLNGRLTSSFVSPPCSEAQWRITWQLKSNDIGA